LSRLSKVCVCVCVRERERERERERKRESMTINDSNIFIGGKLQTNIYFSRFKDQFQRPCCIFCTKP